MHRAFLVLFGIVCAFAQTAPAAAPATAPAEDSKSKTKAIKELAKQAPEAAIAGIQPYLSDPDTEVRIDAVKTIVDIGGPRSLEALVQATRDNDPEVQIRATDGLVNFYSPGYLKTGISGTIRRAGTAVRGKFTDTNDLVVEPYVQVRPEVIAALAALVRGGASMDARANAARAIGILRGKAAVDALVAALRSKDDRLMYESLIALQKIRDQSAAPKFLFLLRDPAERVQIAALETMGLLQNKAAMPEIRDVIERPSSTKVRRAALSALAMLPDESNRRIFDQFIGDKDDQIRAAAAEGIARLKNPADAQRMETLFESERKMNPRLSLAFAAVACGNNALRELSPLQYLVNALDSKAYRGVAEPFLLELARDPGVRRTLYEVFKTGTKDEKIYLARALARVGDQETAKYLEALASDPDSEVADEGMRALRTLKARI